MMAVSQTPADRRPTAVHVTSPADCPERRLEKELAFRTSRVELVADDANATAFVEATIVKKGKRYEGQLTVRAGRSQARKTLSSPRCETVIAAMSLAAALVLDPEHAKTGALPAVLPNVEPTPVAPEPAPAPVEPVAPPVVQPTPEPPAPVVVPAPVGPPVQPAPVEPRWHVSANALGLVSSGVSGLLDVGGGVAGDVSLGFAESPWLAIARVGVGALTGRSITSDAGRIDVGVQVLAQASVGAGLRLGMVRPELGALAQLTTTQMKGVNADETVTSQRWLWAVGPHARLTLLLGDWRVGLLGVLGLNLRREHYVIDPNGVVFSAPPLFGTAALELGRQW